MPKFVIGKTFDCSSEGRIGSQRNFQTRYAGSAQFVNIFLFASARIFFIGGKMYR